MRERTLTVSQLNEYVKGVFEDELILHNLYVEGEIFEYKKTQSATFITLIENEHLLNCVTFESIAGIEQGDKVSLFGSVKFYDRLGKVSFIFKSVRKLGAGNQAEKLEVLKSKLKSEGLFDNKIKLPKVVLNVAIVTAVAGAVIHDFIKTVHRKQKFANIRIFPSSVQGKTAAEEICANLTLADKSDCDVIVIARGGGSNDDLSAFNEEMLVRNIAKCTKPTISAVGHETDFTLCDFACSVRAGTPSMAGEYISRINENFISEFDYATNNLLTNISKIFARKTLTLNNISQMLSYKSNSKLYLIKSRILNKAYEIKHKTDCNFQTRLDTIKNQANSLSEKIDCKYTADKDKWMNLSNKLDKNDPLRILSMGYARLTKENGDVLKYENAEIGDKITAVLQDGKITAAITEKNGKIGAGQR